MAGNKPTTFTIPGTDVKLPQWALLAGAGGILAVFFFMKDDKKSTATPGILTRTPVTTPTTPIPTIPPTDGSGLPSPDGPSVPIPKKKPAPIPTPATPPPVVVVATVPIIPVPKKVPQGPGLYKRPTYSGRRPKPPVGPPGREVVVDKVLQAEKMLSTLGKVRAVAVAVKGMQQVKPKPVLGRKRPSVIAAQRRQKQRARQMNLGKLRRSTLAARRGQPRR